MRYRIFISGLISALCSVLAFWISATVEHNRVAAVADHMLEQVNNRALQDFYELADRVREGLAADVELPSSMVPFVSSRLLSDAWRFDINLQDLGLKVIPTVTDSTTLSLNFHDHRGRYLLFLDAEAWLQALCTDLGFGDLPFSLVYRDQPVFVVGKAFPGSAGFRQDDFIFPQLSLLIDRTPVIDGMFNSRYPMALAAFTFLLMLVLMQTFWRQRFRLKLSGERLRQVETELQQTSDILRSQMQVTANSQKELLKRNYELQDINRTLEESRHQLRIVDQLTVLGELSTSIVQDINTPVAAVGSNLRKLEVDLAALRNFVHTLDNASTHLDVNSEFYQSVLASYQQFNVQQALTESPGYIEDCISAIERVRKSVQDIKRLSSYADSEKTHCNLNDHIDGVISLINGRLSAGIELTTYLVELPDLYCNAAQISQALVSILMNAVQALELDGGRITFSEKVQAKGITLEVCDDGPGMSEEVAGRVFEPFFSSKADASGMGLALSYKLIAEHGGWIDVKTAPAKGACFTIHLPLDGGADQASSS